MSFGELSSADTYICRKKHKWTRGRIHQRSSSKRVTYMDDPQIRGNRAAKEDAPWNLAKGLPIRLTEKDKDELLPGGVGRTQGSAEPGQ